MSQLRLRLLQLLSQKRTKYLGFGLLSFILLAMVASSLFLPAYVKRLVIEKTQQEIGNSRPLPTK